MGLLQTYKGLFDQVKAVVQGVPSIKTVLIGESFRPGDLPMALITPREAPEDRLAMDRILEIRINWDVIILIRETEPESWFDEIIPILCEVHDAFLQDETLGGTAKVVTPTLFSPGEITAQNRLFYGGLIRFQAILLHTF